VKGSHRAVEVAGRTFANDQPLVLIGGINVLESRDLALASAEEYVRVCDRLALP
jgi:2-dehydro-3-deoxyphosphooctonate aldolase (KDO 8-P synthase)